VADDRVAGGLLLAAVVACKAREAAAGRLAVECVALAVV